MVWHGEGWAPPCDIAQDTPHVDESQAPGDTESVLGLVGPVHVVTGWNCKSD